MWKIFTSIFQTMNIKDLMAQTDDWGLTKEETIRYQLEWMRALPTGFQIAQRFIGIAFSIVFLFMVTVTFIMLCFGMDIELLVMYIADTMVNPIMIIFSLFFGGGLINSFKRNGNFVLAEPVKVDNKGIKPIEIYEKYSQRAPVTTETSVGTQNDVNHIPESEEELTRRQKRKLRRQQRKNNG